MLVQGPILSGMILLSDRKAGRCLALESEAVAKIT